MQRYEPLATTHSRTAFVAHASAAHQHGDSKKTRAQALNRYLLKQVVARTAAHQKSVRWRHHGGNHSGRTNMKKTISPLGLAGRAASVAISLGGTSQALRIAQTTASQISISRVVIGHRGKIPPKRCATQAGVAPRIW